MNDEDLIRDWIFRYQYLLGTRFNDKQKLKFIESILKDIIVFRKDIEIVRRSIDKNKEAKDIYIGNIEHADTIICTYYDTPVRQWGSYYLFDKDRRNKVILTTIILETLGLFLFGVLLTYILFGYFSYQFSLYSISGVFCILFYILYFRMFTKISRGIASKNNGIRNTSSVIAILNLLRQSDESIAYAFLDMGCTNQLGLKKLRTRCNKNTQIYYLDCVGLPAELHLLKSKTNKNKFNKWFKEQNSNRSFNYLVAMQADYLEEKSCISRKLLKNKMISYDNIKKIENWIRREEKIIC